MDFYVLPTHNLSLPLKNATYHHSRLMGVSDIENAVSEIQINSCTAYVGNSISC